MATIFLEELGEVVVPLVNGEGGLFVGSFAEGVHGNFFWELFADNVSIPDGIKIKS